MSCCDINFLLEPFFYTVNYLGNSIFENVEMPP